MAAKGLRPSKHKSFTHTLHSETSNTSVILSSLTSSNLQVGPKCITLRVPPNPLRGVTPERGIASREALMQRST
jgi:hypothetical protein